MSFVCLHAQGANEIHTCTSDKMTQEEKYDPKLSPFRLKFTCKRKRKNVTKRTRIQTCISEFLVRCFLDTANWNGLTTYQVFLKGILLCQFQGQTRVPNMKKW